MAKSEGMVQVGGKTYRVVARAEFHDVFRLLDDCYVGTFQHEPELEVIWLEIPGEALLQVARQAVRSARLSWKPKNTNSKPTAVELQLQGIRWVWAASRAFLVQPMFARVASSRSGTATMP